jgi:hypothetical protein
VTENIQLTEMTRKNANIILVDLNLAVKKACGLRVGLAVEKNGTSQDVLGVTTEDILKPHKLNSVSIMVIKTPSLFTLIAIVVDLSFIVIQARRVIPVTMNHATTIQATSSSRIRRVEMVFGHVVALRKGMVNLVPKTSISLLNGLKRMLRSISSIDLSRTHLSRGKTVRQELTLNSMVDSQVILEMPYHM